MIKMGEPDYRPEMMNSIMTSIYPLNNGERLRLWRFKVECRKAFEPHTKLRDFCESP